MKKQHVFLLALFIFLSGCALTNNSFYQTGDTLRQGTFRAGLGISSGSLILAPQLLLPDSEIDKGKADSLNSINPIGSISGFTVTPELYFGYGITDRIELNAKGWVGLATAGGKLGTTFRITKIRSPYKIAISPQFSYSANSDTSKPSIGSNYVFPNHKLIGYELPLINSYSLNRAISLYFVPSYTFYRLSISEWVLTDLNHSYDIHRLGLTLGLSLKGKAIFLRPEVSLNYFKGLSSNPYLSTTMGLGLGIEIPKYL